MSKIAFIFPGQGSQYIGMGKEIVENFPVAAEIMDKANNILDIDLKKLCFSGPIEKLNNTENTQPGVYTISYIIYQILKEKGISPDIVAGHSLGEYSALAASRVFSFEDGLKLVRQRGTIMNNAVSTGKGAMAALIGLEDEKVLLICQKVDGICEIANYNSPGQIVISGEKEAVKQACSLAEEAGAKKAVELAVSGPFHSSLMKSAEREFAIEIDKVEFNKPKYPVVVNVTADFVEETTDIKNLLLRQLSASVRWVESMKRIISQDIDTFIELGPGRVLKGLMRRIDRSANAYNVEDLKSLEKSLKKI